MASATCTSCARCPPPACTTSEACSTRSSTTTPPPPGSTPPSTQWIQMAWCTSRQPPASAWTSTGTTSAPTRWTEIAASWRNRSVSWRNRSLSWRNSSLALHVRELLNNQPVANAKHVDAPHMPSAPIVAPADDAPVPRRELLFRLKPSIDVVAKELLPNSADRGSAFIPPTVRRRPRALKDAIFAHRRHDTVNVAPIEGRVEASDRGNSRS